MNVQIFLLSMFLLLINNSAPQLQNVSQIEFATLTRGYHKNVIVTSAMIMITEQSRNDVSEHIINVKIKKSDWDGLLEAMKNISLEEIPTLSSPTAQRASDAARASMLSITDINGKLYSHTFDNENPNEKLQPLMKCIVGLEQRAKAAHK